MDKDQSLTVAIPDFSDALQDDHAVIEALKKLEGLKVSGGGKEARSKAYTVNGSEWHSWTMRESAYRKGKLPTQARGLFIRTTADGKHRIVVRGYDKFFNVTETEATQWPSLKNQTVGPYEVTAKENGCIIFIAAMSPERVVVTSKHALPDPQDDETAHGGVGYRWLLKHLESVGKTERDLASWLDGKDITLVAELCDDHFQEHVLPYSRKESGLYLHGINLNTSILHTLPSETVQRVAKWFGFHQTQYLTLDTIAEVQSLADKMQEDGTFLGRPVEGIVVRCKRRAKPSDPARDFFFKIKNDQYLLYREYREVTKMILDTPGDGTVRIKPDKKPKCKYEKTAYYVQWVRDRIQDHPEWFAEYKKNKGIIAVRERFEEFWAAGDLTKLSGDPAKAIEASK